MTWSWPIRMKRLMPRLQIRGRQNFWVYPNATHFCAFVKSSIQPKALSFFTFWGYIVPIVTTSLFEDIDKLPAVQGMGAVSAKARTLAMEGADIRHNLSGLICVMGWQYLINTPATN